MKRNRCFHWLLVVALLSACNAHDDHEHGAPAEDESWAVTAWGERFEIFAETDPLEIGAPALAFTHVTVLEDFSPLVEGVVQVVLVDSAGSELSFSRDQSTRPGIFSIEVVPEKAGDFDLIFRVESARGREDIPAGRIRVGESGSGGGLVEAATVTVDAEGAADGAEISFLKEQQWRTEFATSWVATGALSESVRAPGRVRAAAGGEVVLTSPVDGIVRGEGWPHFGQPVGRGAVVFQVTPRVASGRSLAELEAEVEGLAAESEAAGQRLERLEELLELGATSRKELEEAKTRKALLESRLRAAREDLATVHAGRRGGGEPSETVQVTVPFSGRIARVDVTPGQAIAAAEPLGLLVRESPLWVEVALPPAAAVGLGEPAGLVLQMSRGKSRLDFRGDEARLVSLAPAVDPETGMIRGLFEVATNVDDLPIGSAVTAEILLQGERNGIVIPETALVDDGGVTIVYLQRSGEEFIRAEVTVLVRQSGSVLVNGLEPGARIVDVGGNAIRRATLVAKDVGEGHVH